MKEDYSYYCAFFISIIHVDQRLLKELIQINECLDFIQTLLEPHTKCLDTKIKKIKILKSYFDYIYIILKIIIVYQVF